MEGRVSRLVHRSRQDSRPCTRLSTTKFEKRVTNSVMFCLIKKKSLKLHSSEGQKVATTILRLTNLAYRKTLLLFQFQAIVHLKQIYTFSFLLKWKVIRPTFGVATLKITDSKSI